MRQGLVDSVAPCGHLFTAQPEAPASTEAGASGWAVNDSIDTPSSQQIMDHLRMRHFRIRQTGITAIVWHRQSIVVKPQ
jgi:hypothetical protein